MQEATNQEGTFSLSPHFSSWHQMCDALQELSQDGPSLQHAFRTTAKNEPNETPQTHGARHEAVQMMNIIYSTAHDIVEHICEAGCDSLMLKFAVDDLADTLQKLAGDVGPEAEGLDKRLSTLDDED